MRCPLRLAKGTGVVWLGTNALARRGARCWLERLSLGARLLARLSALQN